MGPSLLVKRFYSAKIKRVETDHAEKFALTFRQSGKYLPALLEARGKTVEGKTLKNSR